MSNPQTSDVSNPQPIWQVNAKWVNGVAPGYWLTAGYPPLTLNVSAGTSFANATRYSYAGGTLTLPNNSTNYIFLDPNSSNAPSSNTTGYPVGAIRLGTVVTASGAITSITDDRSWFIDPRPGGVNVQTGSSYTLVAGDFGKCVSLENSGSVALSLDSTLGARFACAIANVGAGSPLTGTVTLTPTSGLINGKATLSLTIGLGAWLFFDGTNWEAVVGGSGGSTQGIVIGFIMNNGAAGNNVGPMLQPPRAGTFSKAIIITKASDSSIQLKFRIKQNGTDVFSSDPTVAAGTASGTVSSSTSLTSNPLPVASSDVFQIDIITGSPAWQFTVQLET